MTLEEALAVVADLERRIDEQIATPNWHIKAGVLRAHLAMMMAGVTKPGDRLIVPSFPREAAHG